MVQSLWYDKYRPTSLDDYVWTNPSVKDQISAWIEKKNIPSLCFAGAPGRGKTSLAWLIIRKLEVSEDDYLFLKGSVDNTSEAIRTKVIEFCELGGWSGLRIVFFDEADTLSHAAQGALRSVMDDYSSSVRFIFTCNFPHRIIDALWSSRMIRIDIDKLPEEDFARRMLDILEAEKVPLETDEAAEAFIAIRDDCYPDLRKAINLLEYSVRDGVLHRPEVAIGTSENWEDYFRSILTKKVDPLREITKIRQTLLSLAPEEMEDVYRFLYHNGTELFADKQMKAIVYINSGQKAHRNALLPDMLLLEVFIKLMLLMTTDE